MTQIELADDKVQIDADILARAFRISTDDLKQGMRQGMITSRFERGENEDLGRVRLTFFSADRRVRVTADESGNILTCSAVDFRKPAVRRPLTKSRAHKDAIGDAGAGAARRARLDTLLDMALQGTFPASDPIAICCEVPRPAVPSADESDLG